MVKNLKTLDLKRFCVSNFCFGGHVFDPFMGVGTTGIVCKELGLDFSGVELSQEYFDISYERLCDDSI